jgi:hypothetical protein
MTVDQIKATINSRIELYGKRKQFAAEKGDSEEYRKNDYAQIELTDLLRFIESDGQ